MFRLSVLLLFVVCWALLVAPAAQARTLYAVEAGEAVAMPHLPSWVQVAGASATVYAADAGVRTATSGGRIARNTFLRVLGGGSSRLQVDVYDESGNSVGLRGWVDPGDVLPSAPGTDWLVSSRQAPLWRAADDTPDIVRGLDTFTPLQQIDGPVQSRVKVRVYRADFSVLDQGWMDLADIGPALPPQTRVMAPGADRLPGMRAQAGSNQQEAFLDSVTWAARVASQQTGVPASVTVAQAILESDWGRSLLAQNANNYFGIKAMGTLGSAGVVWMPTSEYDDAGHVYETMSAFRAYASLTDSLADHDRLLETAPRYAEAMRTARDPRQFAARLYEAGYSTDPAYTDKLISIMDRYDLYRLDA